jgi:hypothetical protein
VTFLILLLTSAIIGVALWALRQVTLQSRPAAVGTTDSTAAPHPREEIQPSEREGLDAVLRKTEEQGRGGAPAN